MSPFWLSLCFTIVLPFHVMAQVPNYDEAAVPVYQLPDPLVLENGTSVQTAEAWPARRAEILCLFKEHVYGTMPPDKGNQHRTRFEVVKEATIPVAIDSADADSESVQAKIIEVQIRFSEPADSPVANLLIFLPAESNKPCPLFLGYNFQGNHSVHPSTAITKTAVWKADKTSALPEEASRGSAASRWPIGLILSRGFGVATVYYGDVDPDFDDQFQNGVHGLFPDLQNRPDNFGSIGAWAWGLQRVLDYLETNPAIANDQIAVFGHSRLGKTALWAGATDERFALVISNDSGCGGAALARRKFGETVKVITARFPHWFCRRHAEYGNHEDLLPVDQHQLISLIAPRPVYIASASEDRWADPQGEFLAAVYAAPVYRLLGEQPFEALAPQMPAINQPIGKRIGYHLREGKHDITVFDWQQYLDFADRHFQETQTSKSNSVEDQAAMELGLKVLAIQTALREPKADRSLLAVTELGHDQRYYTLVRGWLSYQLQADESILAANPAATPERIIARIAFLKKAIRAIDLE